MMKQKNSQSTRTVQSNKVLSIDFNEIYKFKQEDFYPNIRETRYANHFFIQVTNRDVFIDCLEMPGVKTEKGQAINSTRIYMSHAAAQSLAQSLDQILERVHKAGHMESYEEKKKSPKPLSTKIQRLQKSIEG